MTKAHTQGRKKHPHFLEVRLLLNKNNKKSLEDSEVKQVSLEFFTKATTCLTSNFDFTS